MKILIHDWGLLMPGFVLWDSLSTDSKHALLTPGSNKPPAVHIDKIQPSAGAMIEGGWIENGLLDFYRMETEKGLALYSALRQMSRTRLFHPDAEARKCYGEYKSLVLTNPESSGLYRSPTTHGNPELRRWLDSFLNSPNPAAWEREISSFEKKSFGQKEEEHELFDEPGVAEIARELVPLAMKSPAPLPLVGLRGFAEADPQTFQKAFHACVRYFLLFPGLDETMRPIFWILPQIGARIHRKPIPYPMSVEAKPGARVWNLPTDTMILLAHALHEPLQVKARENELFAKTHERLLKDLPPVDPLPGKLEPLEGGLRVHLALQWAMALRWLKSGKAEGKQVLRITPQGEKALNGSAADRLMTFVEAIRKSISKTPEITYYGDAVAKCFEVKPLLVSNNHPHGFRYFNPYEWIEEAFAEIKPGKFYRLEDWLRFFSIERPPQGLLEYTTARQGWQTYSLETESPRILREMLQSFLFTHVLPMGFATPATGPDGEPCFAVGRDISVLIWGTGKPNESLQRLSPGEVIVQADFEIIFLGVNQEAFARLLGFCERIGNMPGKVFRITRASVVAAAEKGIAAERILGELSKWSSKPVPENVRQQIIGWASACRVVEFRPVLLLRLPDEETTLLLGKELGNQAELIAKNTLAVHSGKIDPQLVRKWKNKGIFLRKPPAPAKAGEDEIDD